jgi:hypothetical protein
MNRRGPPAPRTDSKNEQVVIFFSPAQAPRWTAFSVISGGVKMNSLIQLTRGSIGKETAQKSLIASITKVRQRDFATF